MTLPLEPWELSACAAQQQRDQLVRFWLAAPVDQLEALWNSGFGQVSRTLIQQLTANHPFTAEQVSLREAISAQLNQLGLAHPLSHQLLVANFLLAPPGLLRINNADQLLPAWLAAGYRSLYESAPQPAPSAGPAQIPAPQAPDFGTFPGTLQELVVNRIQLNRLLGLSNLYYIDPEDQEIRAELETVRSALADAIQRCPEHDLEQLWSTDLGDRYWALVRSGIQNEALNPPDQSRKQAAVNTLDGANGGGFGTPGAINAFLIAMLYFLPGSMRVDGAENKLPAWLFAHYQQVFAQALPA